MSDATQLLQLANRARDRGRYDEALAHLHKLPDELRAEFRILTKEAELYGRLGDHDREIALYDRLIAGWPNSSTVCLAKANALKTVGRTDDAIAAVRRALALQPGYGKAWWVLADLKTYAFSDEDVASMEKALETSADLDDIIHLHFALGKTFEDRCDPAAAFHHYAQGNALRLKSVPPVALAVTERIDQAIELFTREFFDARDGLGFASQAPIFIVGLPRSGTTLIEQILAAHPDIEGTGELDVIPQLRAELASDETIAGNGLIAKIKSLDGAKLAALGESYVERATAFRSTGRPRFIDKLPTNWLNIGFIQLILPNATIIDARRHPMAAGFSNFRQNYGSGVRWSYSLDAIGRYYRDYLRLLRHFDRVLPGKVHRVIHERLIDDFEPEVRRLLDYVGVGFEPGCLEFHRSSRPVRSASAEQVRRPINRDGVDQWRAFEPWLEPLKDALGDALEDWEE